MRCCAASVTVAPRRHRSRRRRSGAAPARATRSPVRRPTTAAPASLLARWLTADLDALAFLRLPQFPSSRAFGAAPAVTTWEYRSRLPDDPAKVQIVPVPPRPFPAALRDDDLLRPPARPSDTAALVWAAASVIGLPWALRSLWRRWRQWQPRQRQRESGTRSPNPPVSPP